ncbi:MAG: hypothetical protein ACK2U3_13750 [Anaerolineales bacterium]
MGDTFRLAFTRSFICNSELALAAFALSKAEFCWLEMGINRIKQYRRSTDLGCLHWRNTR